MKKLIVPMLLGSLVATYAVAGDMSAELAEMKKQIAELKAAQKAMNIDSLKRQLTEVKAKTGGDNLKWSVDFRTAYDIVDHKLSAGAVFVPNGSGGYTAGAAGATDSENSLWTNKLTLGMAAQPVDNLVFKGALSMYKAYGQSILEQIVCFKTLIGMVHRSPKVTHL